MNFTNWTDYFESNMDEPCPSDDDTALIIAITVLGTSLVISEILPFLSGHKGNGIVDVFVLFLRASSCMINTCLELDEKKHARAEARNDVNINISNVATAKPTESTLLIK